MQPGGLPCADPLGLSPAIRRRWTAKIRMTECRSARRTTENYCGLIPAALITRSYSAISLRTKRANSSGGMSMTSLPRLASGRDGGQVFSGRDGGQVFHYNIVSRCPLRLRPLTHALRPLVAHHYTDRSGRLVALQVECLCDWKSATLLKKTVFAGVRCGALPAVWRRLEDHRRDRRAGGDCQDTHASGVACTRAAALPGAAAGSLPGGLILTTKAVWQHR